MKHFLIIGETASKKNSKQVFFNKYTGKPTVTCSARYKKWHDDAVFQLNAQKNGFYTENCKMVIDFYYGTYRQKDSDNGVSSIFDTLKDCEIIKDDNWQVIQGYVVRNFYDKVEPRAEVYIYNIDEKIDIEF